MPNVLIQPKLSEEIAFVRGRTNKRNQTDANFNIDSVIIAQKHTLIQRGGGTALPSPTFLETPSGLPLTLSKVQFVSTILCTILKHENLSIA